MIYWKCSRSGEPWLKMKQVLRHKCLRSDHGDEYCSKEFERYYALNGIRRKKTIPNILLQNGVAKHLNRVIIKPAKSMRLHSRLPRKFKQMQ